MIGKFVAAIFAGLALAALGGCGFTPLYATQTANGPMSAALSAIRVEPIPDRLGQYVRNNLIDLLNPQGEPQAPAYRLIVRLSEDREGLAIERDTSITRYNYSLLAHYELRDGAGHVVESGKARAIAAYNVVSSQFATLSAEKDAQMRAAREVAETIRLRLAAGFNRRTGQS